MCDTIKKFGGKTKQGSHDWFEQLLVVGRTYWLYQSRVLEKAKCGNTIYESVTRAGSEVEDAPLDVNTPCDQLRQKAGLLMQQLQSERGSGYEISISREFGRGIREAWRETGPMKDSKLTGDIPIDQS